MTSTVASLEASLLGQVALAALVFGAGLPLLFALGIRALALGTGGSAEVSEGGAPAQPHPAGKVIAYAVFAVVVLVALTAIALIVGSGFGMKLSFEHVYPTLVSK
ncbi:hypothetical protein ACUN7V_15185 [Quadrisphaera oryzae]|uniref:hypothetical protein n=1 Tax=Quadrisphaera TaxID=317661 RepID=UPI001645DAEE|nr:hypothetical protein [Quadrisphaera sp. RL12-1S]MBC3760556.1 hypothetical protein [Quadrisphaera sp. RL12-1S]